MQPLKNRCAPKRYGPPAKTRILERQSPNHRADARWGGDPQAWAWAHGDSPALPALAATTLNH